MSQSYEEMIEGAKLTRAAPGIRHELICGRLHKCVHASVANFAGTCLLAFRAEVQLTVQTKICPDLALVATANGKLWLAVEIVSSDDHRTDTVIKKQIYDDMKVPRLWMVDPRYDNVEVYHRSEYGMILKSMLAGREVLTEKLLPEFELSVEELFRAEK